MKFTCVLTDEQTGEEVEVTARCSFSPYTPARIDGRPEHCSPAEGGEVEDLEVYLDGKDITDEVGTRFGEDAYRTLEKAALDEAPDFEG